MESFALPMRYNNIRKFVRIKLQPGLHKYDSILTSARESFNIDYHLPLVLFDVDTDCLIEADVLEDYLATYNYKVVIDVRIGDHAITQQHQPQQQPSIIHHQPIVHQQQQQIVHQPMIIPLKTESQMAVQPSSAIPSYLNRIEERRTSPAQVSQNITFEVINESLEIKTPADLTSLLERELPTLMGKVGSYQPLDNSERKKLANLIVKHRMNHSEQKRIITEEFENFARLISIVFPRESTDIYFTSARNGKCAQGKLFFLYCNYRTELAQKGLITRRPKTSQKPTQSHINSPTPSKPIIPLPPVSYSTPVKTEPDIADDDITYLMGDIVDWEQTKFKWYGTHNTRQMLLASSISTMEYILKFPCLNEDRAYELLKIDVDILYPQNTLLAQKWRQIYKKVIEKSKKLRDENTRNINNHIVYFPNDQEALSILMMPFLMPNNGRKRKFGQGGITKAEIANSFIEHVMSNSEAETKEQERLRVSDGDRSSVQPKIIFVGLPITVAYLFIGEKKYVFHDPMLSVQAAMYFFMGMNIEYPSECNHIWLIVQQLLCNIYSPYDPKIPSVCELINDLT